MRVLYELKKNVICWLIRNASWDKSLIWPLQKNLSDTCEITNGQITVGDRASAKFFLHVSFRAPTNYRWHQIHWWFFSLFKKKFKIWIYWPNIDGLICRWFFFEKKLGFRRYALIYEIGLPLFFSIYDLNLFFFSRLCWRQWRAVLLHCTLSSPSLLLYVLSQFENRLILLSISLSTLLHLSHTTSLILFLWTVADWACIFLDCRRRPIARENAQCRYVLFFVDDSQGLKYGR